MCVVCYFCTFLWTEYPWARVSDHTQTNFGFKKWFFLSDYPQMLDKSILYGMSLRLMADSWMFCYEFSFWLSSKFVACFSCTCLCQLTCLCPFSSLTFYSVCNCTAGFAFAPFLQWTSCYTCCSVCNYTTSDMLEIWVDPYQTIWKRNHSSTLSRCVIVT